MRIDSVWFKASVESLQFRSCGTFGGDPCATLLNINRSSSSSSDTQMEVADDVKRA